MTSVIPAVALARRWGLKTGTLSKWRRLKKGPAWYPLSPTFIVYPLTEVERFEAERREAAGTVGTGKTICGAKLEPRMPQEVAD